MTGPGCAAPRQHALITSADGQGRSAARGQRRRHVLALALPGASGPALSVASAWAAEAASAPEAANPPHAPGSVRELHGATDRFAGPGVALAWGVLRGADEASTQVLIRIVADGRLYAQLDVLGRDPFTQGKRQHLVPTAITGPVDLAIARTAFADHPRTEFRFHRAAPDGAATDLLVFYLGVPDTTPEFTQATALGASLNLRIDRALRAR